MTSTRLTYSDYSVGWVCAISKEHVAAIAMLDHRHYSLATPSTDSNTYTLGSIGSHNVVIACLPKGKVGNISAAAVAAQMVSTFHCIKFALMVGIGGGIPPKVRLGDVVVSTPVGSYPGVMQWDFGKLETNNQFSRIGSLNNPPTYLLTALAKLEAENELTGSRIPHLLEEMGTKWPNLARRYLKSDSLQDNLFRADYNHVSSSGDVSVLYEGDSDDENICRSCDKTQILKRKAREMRVHYGLIASGNSVIEDAQLRDQLNQEFSGHCLCVETEAAGLMGHFPCIVIRGICDYADSHKNNNWHEHAAAVAAAFAKELLGYVQCADLRSEPTAKDILQTVKESVIRTEELLRNQKTDLDRKNILRWLAPIDYTSKRSDFIQRRQPGTGLWFTTSREYVSWRDGSECMLFCPGIPGAGKSIMASIIIEDLEERFVHEANIGIAYIYCSFQEQDAQKLDYLLSSILAQLLMKQLLMPECVRNLYGTTRPVGDRLLRVLHEVVSSLKNAFIIIDALDECQGHDGCRQLFLSKLVELASIKGAKVLVTSRLIPEVTRFFKEFPVKEIFGAKEDIDSYLGDQMIRMPGYVGSNPDLQNEIKRRIVDTVDGMFLLARLHFDSLIGKRSVKALRKALTELATGSNAYSDAYQAAMHRIHGQTKDEVELAMQTLSWLVCAKKPLSIWELQNALAVEEEEDEIDKDNISDVDHVLSVCAGLVTVDDNNITRLVHYTAHEYLEKNQGKWLPDAEVFIARTCLSYLGYHYFSHGMAQTDSEFEERLADYPFYNYAAKYWGYHALCMKDCEDAIRFLEKENQVEASTQVLFSLTEYDDHFGPGYSQWVPRSVTGMHLAAYFGHRRLLEALHLQNDLEFRDSYGKTSLIYASDEGSEICVQFLIENGADVEAVDIINRGPLWCASSKGHIAVVQILLENDAIVSVGDLSNQTPLACAAQNGHESVVELLIRKGADIDVQDNYGQIPLSFAAWNGKDAVVKVLLDSGARIDIEDQNGSTALDGSVTNGCAEATRLLISAGADIDKVDRYGSTPLSSFARLGHADMVDFLLNEGANSSSENYAGRSALFYAVQSGSLATVKRLVADKRVRINVRDHWGATPLMMAIRGRHKEILDYFLTIPGVDTNCKDRFGRNLLQQVQEQGSQDLTELIEAISDFTSSAFEKHMNTLPQEDATFALRRVVEQCDVCWLVITEQGRYCCETCHLGDFHICLDCYQAGARCFSTSHVLTIDKDGYS